MKVSYSNLFMTLSRSKKIVIAGVHCNLSSLFGFSNYGNITTTERRKVWSRQEIINAMEFFCLSQPERRGYMKRMLQLWQERRLFDISDQRIADQVRVIRRNGLMSNLELEEIKNRVLNVPSHAVNCTQTS